MRNSRPLRRSTIWRPACSAAGLKVARAKDEPPTNVNVVAEVRPVLRQPERDPSIETGVWLWGAADNLRVPAATAVAIAEKLLAS